MSSDPFDLLGIDRATATEADVRRAYAERLKVTRPEDDRAGFMALRAAFESARNQVRWRRNYSDDAYTEEDENENESDPATSEGASFPVGAVAIGDVPLAEIAERLPEGLPETKPAHAEIEPYEEDPAPADEEPYEQEDEEFYEDDGPSPEELAAWAPIQAVLDRLTDVLTATGKPPRVSEVMAIVDDDDVSGIEQFQTMQLQVRQLLCSRTGHFEAEPKTIRLPDWLSLEVLDALDAYYGWSRQTSPYAYIRGMNDWIARVRQAIVAETSLAPEHRPASLRDVTADLFGETTGSQSDAPARGGGGTVWLWIGAGILLSQIVRFVANLNGGG